MNRDLTLEKHLLSKSYDSESEIAALLEERYSLNGSQKHFLSLFTTQQPVEAQPAAPTAIDKNLSVKPTAERRRNVRAELKTYIRETLRQQNHAVKSIQRLVRSDSAYDITALLKKHKVPIYNEYAPLHRLWQLYMGDLLFDKNATLQQMLPKLATADYVGCAVTVLELRNANMVGTRGIVIFDSQHNFIVVVPQLEEGPPARRVGGLRVLPKRGSLFGFDVVRGNESLGFTIIGSRFMLRLEDRSSKKFKSHDTKDI